MNQFLFNLYTFKSRRLRAFIRSLIARIENGEMHSVTLRQIFSKYHNVEIGMYSYGGCFYPENMPDGTVIGRYCSFARNIFILNGNHPTSKKSLHPFFYNPVLGYVDNLLITRTNLIIENDVWVGQNVIVLPSVNKIENGAVIGAGSVVTKNIPPYAIIAGNPARIIKYRFSQQTMDHLIETAWWSKDINQIKEDRRTFDTFLKSIE